MCRFLEATPKAKETPTAKSTVKKRMKKKGREIEEDAEEDESKDVKPVEASINAHFYKGVL